MSIPTSVFENGRWVTRYLDIHHVVAQNIDPETAKTMAVAEVPQPPSLGLLSRTIVRSPVVQWIIPARIRHPDKNDVLYITAESVEIKETRRDYTLRHVATKADFDSPIRAARICGLPRELTKPDIDAIIKREEHWGDVEYRDFPKDAGQPMDEDSETIFKEEEVKSVTENEDDEAEMRSLQTIPLHTRTLSPHILILALESGKLVFMYTISGNSETPYIVTSQRALWKSRRQTLEQIGRHIAADPRSRAVAVAAQERLFYMYALRSMKELQGEVRKRSRLDPIVSEQAFEVDGTILRMEFLYPAKNDNDRIILLLVVCKQGKSQLVWYEWNSAQQPLTQAHVKTFSHDLPNDERIPLLLIPMKAFKAFILVCENRIIIYRDLWPRGSERYIHNLSHHPEPEEVGTSKRRPIWVQWARAMRSATHRAQGDVLYLCREDGVVHFLALKYDHPSLIDSNYQVGKLGTNTDSSFGVLDVGPQTSDLLAAGGDGSEGGLWTFGARENAKRILNDPNWTPVVDSYMAAVPRKPQAISATADQVWGDETRIFACVGKAKHGAVSEFRYGIAASRHLAGFLPKLLNSGILAVWAFRSNQNATSYVVLCHLEHTSVVRIWTNENDEEHNLLDVVEESRALSLDERTIAIRAIPGGRVIQITEKVVRSALLDAVDEINPGDCLCHPFHGARVVAACIGVPGFEALTLVAFEEDGRYYLQLAEVNNIHQVIGKTQETEFRPTAVALKRIVDDLVVFVSFVNGSFRIFLTEKESMTVWQTINDYKFSGEFAICESIATSVLAKEGDGNCGMLIACGLRNGSVHILIWQRRGHSYQISCYGEATFGNTLIHVAATTATPFGFIVHSRDQIYSLECRSLRRDVMSIHRIWIADHDEPTWQQGQFSAIAVVEHPDSASPELGSADLVCVDRELVHIVTLHCAAGPRNVPRRLNIGGSPTRVLYSNFLHKLIVLSNRVSELRPSRVVSGRFQPGKRTTQPRIMFVDPNTTHKEVLDDDSMEIDSNEAVPNVSDIAQAGAVTQQEIELPFHEPGERFLGITEWFPKVGGKEYHLLVVNAFKKDGNPPATGRLLLFGVKAVGDHTKLIFRKATSPSGQIHAVAAHPNRTSIVYCCGEELCILSILEVQPFGSKWAPPIKIRNRSFGRHLTIKTPYIYVTTAGSSLAVFRQKGDTIAYLCSDTVARNGLHHINIPSLNLIIMSDMGGSITGLWQTPDSTPMDHSLSTLFEASFSESTIRLHPVIIPIWLREHATSDSNDPEAIAHEWLSGQRIFVGTSATGTIRQHRLLASFEWPFLRFLQNLAERSPLICPYQEAPSKRHLDPARTKDPKTRAINGDILMRLVEGGSGELIWSLMNKPPKVKERHLDFDSVEDRWARFKQLYLEFVIGRPSELPPSKTDDGELKAAVVLVLREALQRLL